MLNKLREHWIKLTVYGTVIGLFIYLMLTTDFQDMLYHIKRIRVEIISILVLFQCVTQYLLGLQWNRICRYICGKSHYGKMFYVLSTGSVIEALTPGAKIGGEVTRLHYLKKEMNLETKEATNLILVQKSISMSVLFSLCIISMVYLFLTISMDLSLFVRVLLIALAILVLLALIFLLVYSQKLIDLCERHDSKATSKILPWLHSYNGSLKMLPNREWILQFFISSIVWILFPVKMLILSRSMGVDEHFLVLLTLTMTAYMIGTLPLTPGGVGTFEGTMLTLLTMVGVEQVIGISITVVFRIITFWLVMLISLLYTMLYSYTRGRGSDE